MIAGILRRLQFGISAIVLVAVPFPYGSVDLFWIAVWTLFLSIAALIGPARELNRGQFAIVVIFFAVAAAYAGIALLQYYGPSLGDMSDGIWQKAATILNVDLTSRIASRAAIPATVLGHFLLFATASANGFWIGSSRGDSQKLFNVAKYSFVSFAVYAFVWALFFPDLLLWAKKVAYHENLTGTFVNRNTAATFFGAGTIAWTCSALSIARGFKGFSLRALILLRTTEAMGFALLLRLVGALLCLLALLQTGSRGGLVCTILALVVVVPLMLTRRSTVGVIGMLAIATGVAGFLLLVGVGSIAGRGLFDDGRWTVYEVSIRALLEKPIFGYGVGSFADVFPSFRSDQLSSWGVWDLAHSTILEIAFETGLPFALLLSLMALGSIAVIGRAAFYAEPQDRVLLASALGIAILSFSHAAIDFSLQIPGYFVVFAMLWTSALLRATDSKKMPPHVVAS